MLAARWFAADAALRLQTDSSLFLLDGLDGLKQAFRRFAAGAVDLMLAVPVNPLFERGLYGHFVLLVPEFVHFASSLRIRPATAWVARGFVFRNP